LNPVEMPALPKSAREAKRPVQKTIRVYQREARLAGHAGVLPELVTRFSRGSWGSLPINRFDLGNLPGMNGGTHTLTDLPDSSTWYRASLYPLHSPASRLGRQT
jgi:hypothetical protein